MEQDKEKSPPSSAGCDTDRCEKRDNSAQKDERNEERKESFLKHKGSQRSVTEEQEIADEEISREVVQKKVPGETISNLPHKPFYPSPISSSYFSKHPHEMANACLQHRKLVKQSKPTSASASVLPCSETSNVILQGSGTAEKQKEQMFPFKRTKPGPLTDSAPFPAGFNSNVTSHNTSNIEQSVKELKFEFEQLAFSVQSQSEPGVDHSLEGGIESPVTAEQSLIRKKTAADKSKPQSKVSSTSPVASVEMLRDTLKGSTPGISVDTKCMNFVRVPPKPLVNTSPFSLVHPTYALWSDYLPPNQPSFIHKQSEKQRTADDKFSEDEVQVELSSQSVGSLPQNSSIYGLHDYRFDTHLINATLSPPYHHQHQQQQLLKPTSFRPVHNKIAKRRGVEKKNQVSTSTSVCHDRSISDPVLGNKVPQRKKARSRKRVVPQGSSTAEKQKEQTFPIEKTKQRSLSEASSAANSRNSSDSPDDILDPPPPALTETGMKIKSSSAAGDTTGASQDNTGEMEGVTGPSTFQPSTSNDDDLDFSLLADAFSPRSLHPESESGGDRDAHVEMEAFVTAVNLSVTNTLPTHFHLLQTPDYFRSRRATSCLPRSHSVSSVSQKRSAENKILRRTQSLPNMLLKSSFVEFTPDITDDGNDESYRFLCSCPGLYQCSVTGLVFHMDGEGEVVYRMVPWNRRLLAQHHKQPAGPLFDIKCLQQSVCQLHLPHCEIRSTGGCEFLSVAHVHDESIEFINPHQITDTHVIINITGFSGFGNVKDEDSPPDPVRALVLLFYKPPAAPDVTSVLNVLMLPRNVVLQEVKRTRKKLVGDENYIETSSRCKLHSRQEYTLSTCPEDESVLVQPRETEFECDNYDNYIPSFQVNIKKILKHINLFLRDSNKHNVWEREVCLSSTGVKRSCVPGESTERLLEIRSSFIERISGPVLKDLLDRLFEIKVITDSERESADAIQDKRDKARFVIDTVRKKGEAASLEMIEYLCENDPFLCEHLGLI